MSQFKFSGVRFFQAFLTVPVQSKTRQGESSVRRKAPEHCGNIKLHSNSSHEFEEKDIQTLSEFWILKKPTKLLVGHDVQLPQASPEYRHHLTWVLNKLSEVKNHQDRC